MQIIKSKGWRRREKSEGEGKVGTCEGRERSSVGKLGLYFHVIAQDLKLLLVVSTNNFGRPSAPKQDYFILLHHPFHYPAFKPGKQKTTFSVSNKGNLMSGFHHTAKERLIIQPGIKGSPKISNHLGSLLIQLRTARTHGQPKIIRTPGA